MWEALLFHTGIMDAMLGCVGVVWEYVRFLFLCRCWLLCSSCFLGLYAIGWLIVLEVDLVL